MTCMLPGVVPEAGVALSQLTPFCVELVTREVQGGGAAGDRDGLRGRSRAAGRLGKGQRGGGSGDAPGIDLEMTLIVAGLFPAPGEVTSDGAVVSGSRSQLGSIDAEA